MVTAVKCCIRDSDDSVIQGYLHGHPRQSVDSLRFPGYTTSLWLQKFASVIFGTFAWDSASLYSEIIIAIPAGVGGSQKAYSLTDYRITVIALIGISLPSFFFATIFEVDLLSEA